MGKSFSWRSTSHLSSLKSRFQNSKSLLKRTHKTKLTYLSAVPHQICAYADTNVVQVANSLAAHLSICLSDPSSLQVPGGLAPSLLDHLDIQATPSGYLEFKFDDWAIAHWLTCLTYPVASLFVSLTPPAHPVTRPRPSLFSIQHAHARCCSLLRLAVQQQIIGLTLQEPSQWQWTQPNPIDWFTMAQQFRLSRDSERQLISQCFTVLDEFPWQAETLPENIPSSSLHLDRITTLAQDLAQAFSTLHQQCQIWGALQTEGSDHLTAHFALILVTQRLLYGLLQSGLGVIAPDEL